MAYLRNDHAATRSYLEESLARFRQAASVPGVVSALNRLGDLARYQGDYTQAEMLYAECIALYRDVGDRDEFPGLLHNLAYAVQHRGDYVEAINLFREGLMIQQEIDNQAGIAKCVTGIAGSLIGQGEVERGARLLGAAEVLRESVGATLWPANRLEYDRNLACLHDALDETTLATAWTIGRAMTLQETIVDAQLKARHLPGSQH